MRMSQARRVAALEEHSSAHWIAGNKALEGEVRIGNLTGKWIAEWDNVAKQITQHIVNSDGARS